ncbi:MAG: ABC-F family ATP-binding cassette domain-containing protein [Thermonemataceae bacterium]
MNYISAERIGKSFGDRWLFRELSLGISQGEKVALVGTNGTGKTTLMRILAQQIPPDEGEVAINKDITIGFLSQSPQFEAHLSVQEALFVADNPTIAAIQKYEACLQNPAAAEALQAAIEQMDALQAWDYEAQVKQILGQLGIRDTTQRIEQLSGGQKKRVALARLLILAPDLLILDEPTNHLDIETIEWLEKQLETAKQTLLLVTHDRYFLDNVCNTIIELDQGALYHYKGNYGYFLEKKAERQQQQQTEIDKAKNLYSKELEWIRRQPKARGTKAKYRVEAFQDIKKEAFKDNTKEQVQLDTKTTRQGKKIVELHQLYKRYGEKVLIEDFSYVFKRGDKVGVVGKNGVGKSTFLHILSGELAPDRGEVIKGSTTLMGYYKQEDFAYKEGQRVIDIVKEVAEFITLSNGDQISASQFLNRFLFPPEVQYKPVEKLSGGEKKRLQLMRVLIKNPNFLILDEPTNDLDLDTLRILETFLQHFNGCLLLVSHDRYFMDQLVEHLFVLEGNGRIKDFNGNYTDYRQWLDQQQSQQKKETKKTVKSTTKPSPEKTKKKLSYKEKKEMEQLEGELAALEDEKARIITQMNGETTDHEQLAAWAEQVEAITQTIEAKEMRWLLLSEMAE